MIKMRISTLLTSGSLLREQGLDPSRSGLALAVGWVPFSERVRLHCFSYTRPQLYLNVRAQKVIQNQGIVCRRRSGAGEYGGDGGSAMAFSLKLPAFCLG